VNEHGEKAQKAN